MIQILNIRFFTDRFRGTAFRNANRKTKPSYALPNNLQKAFEAMEISKIELVDLIENHKNVFREWL